MTTETHDMTAAGTTPRWGPRGWLVLITLCGATLMTGLDYSIITVALPEIGRDLGFSSASALQWVATACLLPTAALMPLFGRASDMVGRRRLFVIGVAAFSAFSLLAGLAPTPGLLVAARAGQGVAAAMIGPTALALMTGTFQEGPQRTRALGVNGALLSLGFVVGTIGGGLITSGLNWRWTMLVLFGIGVLVMTGAVTVVRETAVRGRARLDVPGALLASGGLFALVYDISTGRSAGWGSLPTLATLTAAALVAGGFAARMISTRGTAATIVTGLTVQAAGTAAMVFLPAQGGLVLLLATSATMGFGHVLTVVAAVTTITSGLDEADQGVAGSLAQMPTFVGAVGVAGLTAIAAARTEAFASVATEASATLGGLHAAFLVAGAVALTGAFVGGALLRRPAPAA
ncbi:MFS transporter [Nonomuraea sp. NPDC001023]|uniref:MFS transporter n=1 Tax=unclassified Nonomuraea TaxID=2593643 RepID=UPI003316CEEB